VNDLVRRYHQAWNDRSSSALAGLFAADGRYLDPLCPQPLAPSDLAPYTTRWFAALGDLRFVVDRVTGGGDAAALEWTLEATCRGALDAELAADGVAVRLTGVDVLRARDGALTEVRRVFDRRALADALGLQTIVEPVALGAMTFGHSIREWASKARPAVLGMTWIEARDEAEKATIRGHARQIVQNFRDTPGFVGIVTGFAGLHGFTFTAWESEAALRAGVHGPAHSEAMRRFREDGLAGGVFTSVWTPHRFNRQWVRCASCGRANDATRADRACEACGARLPDPAPYL
jgi:heme-degrading monooxygenase HmoA/ketosteroid isomerase-like protein